MINPKPKPILLSEIIESIKDELITILGPTNNAVTHPATIVLAESPQAITFCVRNDGPGLEAIRSTQANVVICNKLDSYKEIPPNKTLIVTNDPRKAFIKVITSFFAPPRPSGIHSTALVESSATVHAGAYIGPMAYIGESCAIGEGSVIHGRVYLYSGTRIGRNVTIHAGTVIGADGFGYHRDDSSGWLKFPHLGGVKIEDDVEIGANTCIDRGTLGDTVIRQGAKIDNLCHIAHNVVVGKNATVIALAMVGGSTQIGEWTWISPSSSLRDGLTIGRDVKVGMGSVVVRNIPAGETWYGVPARPAKTKS